MWLPDLLELDPLLATADAHRKAYAGASPFPHVVIDDFLPAELAAFLSERFPGIEHPVWLDWRKRPPAQWGKQGPGDSTRFETLDPAFLAALQDFNSWKFLQFLERLTGIHALLPDPYFTGGGIHQILPGGILDIHTDFNDYKRLGIYRRLNVLIYLTREWRDEYGGALELWDGGKHGGKCVRSIPPVFNRCLVFNTDKHSFHGHPVPWAGPPDVTRRSIALYYYTAAPAPDERYDANTDFQGVVQKALPES